MQDQDSAAVELLERALRILRRAPAPDAARISALETRLANLLMRQGRLEEAETMIRRAMRDEGAVGPGARGLLAGIQAARGDAAGACASLEAAVRASGAHDGAAAACLFELARLRRVRGDGAGADRALAEAQAAWARVPVPLDLAMSRFARGIAYTLLADGRQDLAEAVLRPALESFASHLGEESLATTDLRVLLAVVLHDQRRYDESAAEFRAALAGYRRASGDENPATGTCLLRLSQIAIATDDRDALAGLGRDAERLEKLAAGLGADHPHRSGVLLLRGTIDLGLGAAAAAEQNLRECVTLRSRLLGEGHRMTAYARTVLGGALAALGRYDEAEPLLLASVPIVERQYGRATSMAAEARSRLVILYEATGRPDDADQWR